MTDPTTPRQVLRLGALTDLHLATPGTPPGRFNDAVRLDRSHELLTDALEWLRPRADALVLLGDLADAATEPDYRYLLDRLDGTGLTTYLVPGNHDLNDGDGDGDGAVALSWALATAKGANVVVPPAAGVRVPPLRLASAALHHDHTGYRIGGLDDGPAPDGDGWPLVWLTHFPVLSRREETERKGLAYAGDLANRDLLEAHLRRHDGPVIVLAGHLHTRDHAISDHVLQLDQAALVERPHDAAVITITVDGDTVEVDRQCRPMLDAGHDSPAATDPPRARFRWDGRRWHRTTPGTELNGTQTTEGRPDDH